MFRTFRVNLNIRHNIEKKINNKLERNKNPLKMEIIVKVLRASKNQLNVALQQIDGRKIEKVIFIFQ